nr:uncharacterized protein LOC125420811 [Ziziphus jujuba var. spinosa]
MISFDINKEVITRTPLPTDIAIHKDLEINNYVGVKDGDLAVLNAVKPEDDEDEISLFVLFSLWKLPEIGNKDSWEHSLAITRPLEWFSPTWVIWNGCLVFWNYKNMQDEQNHQTLSFFDIGLTETLCLLIFH